MTNSPAMLSAFKTINVSRIYCQWYTDFEPYIIIWPKTCHLVAFCFCKQFWSNCQSLCFWCNFSKLAFNCRYSLVYVFFLYLYKNCPLLLKLFYINIFLKYEIPSPIGIYENMYLQWDIIQEREELATLSFTHTFGFFPYLNIAKLSPAQSNSNSVGWAEIALISTFTNPPTPRESTQSAQLNPTSTQLEASLSWAWHSSVPACLWFLLESVKFFVEMGGGGGWKVLITTSF